MRSPAPACGAARLVQHSTVDGRARLRDFVRHLPPVCLGQALQQPADSQLCKDCCGRAQAAAGTLPDQPLALRSSWGAAAAGGSTGVRNPFQRLVATPHCPVCHSAGVPEARQQRLQARGELVPRGHGLCGGCHATQGMQERSGVERGRAEGLGRPGAAGLGAPPGRRPAHAAPAKAAMPLNVRHFGLCILMLEVCSIKSKIHSGHVNICTHAQQSRRGVRRHAAAAATADHRRQPRRQTMQRRRVRP